MFKRILLALGILIAIFLVYALLKPAHYVISREITINAQPEVIFPYINNPQKSNEWMPWQEQDSDLQMSYSGPESGVGATSSWVSTGQMGSGTATIIESEENRMVKTKLEYFEPMQMTQTAEITLTPTENATLVKWSVEGENGFLGRVFSIFWDMDKMVGDTFMKGLSQLKNMLEMPS